MGYRVALWERPPDLTRELLHQVLERMPHHDVDPDSGVGRFADDLRERYPSLASRPLMTYDVCIDDEAPFQLRVSGPFAVVEVGWGDVANVMPIICAAAARAGLSMYVEDTRAFLEPGDASMMLSEWREADEREVAAIDAWFDEFHPDEAHAQAEADRPGA